MSSGEKVTLQDTAQRLKVNITEIAIKNKD